MVNYSNPLVPEEESVFTMTKASQLLISVLTDSRNKLGEISTRNLTTVFINAITKLDPQCSLTLLRKFNHTVH